MLVDRKNRLRALDNTSSPLSEASASAAISCGSTGHRRGDGRPASGASIRLRGRAWPACAPQAHCARMRSRTAPDRRKSRRRVDRRSAAESRILSPHVQEGRAVSGGGVAREQRHGRQCCRTPKSCKPFTFGSSMRSTRTMSLNITPLAGIRPMRFGSPVSAIATSVAPGSATLAAPPRISARRCKESCCDEDGPPRGQRGNQAADSARGRSAAAVATTTAMGGPLRIGRGRSLGLRGALGAVARHTG